MARLVVAFGWLVIPFPISHAIANTHDDLVYAALKWLVTSIVAVLAFGVERRKPLDYGIRRVSALEVAFATTAAAIGLMLCAAITLVAAAPSTAPSVAGIAAVPIFVRATVVGTTSICEEFIRAFAVEELSCLLSRRTAGAGAVLLFAVTRLQVYGASPSLACQVALAALLTVLYLRMKCLPACVIAHAMTDGFFLIVGPALISAV